MGKILLPIICIIILTIMVSGKPVNNEPFTPGSISSSAEVQEEISLCQFNYSIQEPVDLNIEGQRPDMKVTGDGKLIISWTSYDEGQFVRKYDSNLNAETEPIYLFNVYPYDSSPITVFDDGSYAVFSFGDFIYGDFFSKENILIADDVQLCEAIGSGAMDRLPKVASIGGNLSILCRDTPESVIIKKFNNNGSEYFGETINYDTRFYGNFNLESSSRDNQMIVYGKEDKNYMQILSGNLEPLSEIKEINTQYHNLVNGMIPINENSYMLLWYDYIKQVSYEGLKGTIVYSNGSIGRRNINITDATYWYDMHEPAGVADELGNMLIVWEDARDVKIFGQFLNPNGDNISQVFELTMDTAEGYNTIGYWPVVSYYNQTFYVAYGTHYIYTKKVYIRTISIFPDFDMDGVIDYDDACPSENPDGADADSDGCIDTVESFRDYLLINNGENSGLYHMTTPWENGYCPNFNGACNIIKKEESAILKEYAENVCGESCPEHGQKKLK